MTITLPDAGKRFMSMQVINQDHYAPTVVYEPGTHTLTREKSARATCWSAIRTLVDPDDPKDVQQVHALQDAIKVEQTAAGQVRGAELGPGQPEEVRDALLVAGYDLHRLQADVRHARTRSIRSST